MDAEHRFLLRSTDFQQKRFEGEDGSLGFPPPEPLGERLPDLHYFLLGEDAFALDCQILQPKTTDQGRNNSQLQDLQGQEGGAKHLWNLSESLQGTTRHHGAKVKGCQRHCVYVCGVAQHDEDTPGRGRQATKPRK